MNRLLERWHRILGDFQHMLGSGGCVMHNLLASREAAHCNDRVTSVSHNRE